MADKKLVTPTGRTSFMKVYEAETNMAGTAKVYSLKLLFPKEMDMSWIENAWKHVCREEFGSENPRGLRPLFSAGNPYDDKGAIMDGDWKYNNVDGDKKEMYEAYRGHWVMGFTVPESNPPAVVDENKNEILDQGSFQSGDYARVAIQLSSYMSKKFRNPQVSIRFGAVQKVRDGERFGGGISQDQAVNMFDEVPTKDGDSGLGGLL